MSDIFGRQPTPAPDPSALLGVHRVVVDARPADAGGPVVQFYDAAGNLISPPPIPLLQRIVVDVNAWNQVAAVTLTFIPPGGVAVTVDQPVVVLDPVNPVDVTPAAS